MTGVRVAFEGVTVVPMDSDRVLDEHTVVVDGAQVAWMGPSAEARIGPGVQRIDGRRRFLMPGLADMHTHPLTEDDLLLFVANGVTTVRNLCGMPRHLRWRDAIADGDLLGPTILTTGPIVDGRPVRNPWTVSVVTREEAEQAVLVTSRGGYDALKVYDQLTLEAYDWLVGCARDYDLVTVGHVPYRVGLQHTLDAGQGSIEHFYGYVEALQPRRSPPGSEPRTADEMRRGLLAGARTAVDARIEELAAATREADVWNCPTLLLRQRWLQDREALVRHPQLRYVSPTRAEHWRLFPVGYPSDEARSELWALYLRLTKALSDAGAGLLVGTDAGVPMIFPGFSVHEELRAFVEAGLTPFEALRAATAAPATFLGTADEVGTVAPGRRADLVLVDANPLNDIANATRIAGVMVRGRWLPGDELQGRLDDLARRQSAGSRRVTPTREPAVRTSQRGLRYEIAWRGVVVGEETVFVEPLSSGGHRLHTAADVEILGSSLLFGVETGTYRGRVEVDGEGVDRAAWFEHDGADGHQRVEAVLSNGHVQVRVDGTAGARQDERFDVAGSALLGRPLTALYLRIAQQFTDLDVGEHGQIAVIGPGLPPDFGISSGTIVVERMPSLDDDPGPRFTFTLHKPNVVLEGTITCDHDGVPVQVALAGSSPVVTSRRW